METLTLEERIVFAQLKALKEMMVDGNPTTSYPIHQINMTVLLGDRFPDFLCYIFESNLTPIIYYLADRDRMTEYEFVVFIAKNYGTHKKLIRALRPHAFQGFAQSCLFPIKQEDRPWNIGIKTRISEKVFTYQKTATA